MADLTRLAGEVDALLTERSLVFGSLPEDAHDLDLLLHRRSMTDLARGMPAAGFTQWGKSWVRVAGASTLVVETVDVAEWRLPTEQVDVLFDHASPLSGLHHLAEPAPHHLLLILARRLIRSPGVLDGKKLRRIDRALESDREAFVRARRVAAAWGCVPQLEVLADLHRGRRAVTRYEAWQGCRAEQKIRGRQGVRAFAHALRDVAGRPRIGAVIALSGLDGAGKSTQAVRLADSLEALGYEAFVGWQRVTYDPSLDRLTAPVRALLNRFRPSAESSPATPPTPVELPPDRQATRALRERFPAVGFVWVTIVALRHTWQVRRLTRQQTRQGRIVIRDRYEIDTVVQLREKYGATIDVRWHVRLVHLLSPRPLAAYFLDVSAAEAWRRKPDEFDPEQLKRHRDRYLAELPGLGVERLDGEQPADEISERVLLEVWRLLKNQ